MPSELVPTPGPWATEYRKQKNGMRAQEVFDSSGETIAVCAWYPVKVSSTTTATNREANARLIAAAPTLLDVVKQIRNEAAYLLAEDGYEPPETRERLDLCDQAIAKARGMAANAS